MTAPRPLHRPPSAWHFMARALLPKPRRSDLPALGLALPPLRPAQAELDAYLRLTGLPQDGPLPLTWPQVWGFRLQMALLTDRAFPLPIWSALQVRNRLLQHAPVHAGEAYARATRVAGRRRLDKGVEIDLHSALHDAQGTLVWESLTTFYWRGRGSPTPDAPSPLAASPAVEAEVIARWPSGQGSGWHFGALTGDYNGLHWNDAYARAFGFARAFHHPPRIAGQCLARLPAVLDAPAQRLDLWIKGPVFYRTDLALRARHEGPDCHFALQAGGDPRPALVGHWTTVAPGTPLSGSD